MLQIAVPPRTSPVWNTPMFQQYWAIKEHMAGALLFYRMGDFYELFGQDAVDAAPLLEIQLTARAKDSETPVPMCGVPVHALDSYAEKILGAGRKIAICEQLSEPTKGVKLVERGVIRVLTPGLPVDYKRLEARAPHWFLSLAPGKGEAIQVAVLDFLAAEYFTGELDGEEALRELLSRLDPQEILVPVGATAKGALSILEGNAQWSRRITPWTGQTASANVEDYLLYTQRCKREELTHFLPDAKPLSLLTGKGGADEARMPASVLEQWDIFPPLFDLLDRCGSAVGSRRLRRILSRPLKNAQRLVRRQKAFEALTDADGLQQLAQEIYDFDRILGRFRVGAASPRELLRLLHSLKASLELLSRAPTASPAWQALIADEKLGDMSAMLARVAPLAARLDSALDTTVDLNRASGLLPLVRPGFDAQLDSLRTLHENAEKWLQDFEERLKNETQIPSLKVRYNRVFGYYIEVTKTHLTKTPASFERKQTTAGGERFTCAELREKESEILTAGARAEAKAQEILSALQDSVLNQEKDLRDLSEHLSWVDALSGVKIAIKKLSRFGSWQQPQISEGPFRFDLVDGRHPLIENIAGSFVPNSVSLDSSGKRLLLLTGPNMAGKSTLMRQAGLCLLLAQCGLPVPAKSLTMTPCSGFFSRMGASDKILQGESTFMVEMRETASLLREADANSFVLVDEIGRGTSTQDGLAIAQAVLEYLHNDMRCVTVFATHYHELTQLAEELPGAVNGSMGIREWKGDLVFLRTLDLKPAEKSYGLYVAKMAGLPKSVLASAKEHFTRGARDFRPATAQMDLFASAAPLPVETAPQEVVSEEELALLKHLRELEVDALSPRDAWKLVDDWKRSLT